MQQVVVQRRNRFSLIIPLWQNPHYYLYHEPQQRQPDQCHRKIEAGVSVGDLTGDYCDLISMRRYILNQPGVWFDKPDEQARA